MSEKNEIIICVDCSQEFELSAGWVKLLQEKPEVQKPKRCYSCRKKAKAERSKEGSNEESRW